jgi:hypothetical protein
MWKEKEKEKRGRGQKRVIGDEYDQSTLYTCMQMS